MSNRLECPILKSYGIDVSNAGWGEDQDWVKSLCTNCWLPVCVFDKKGKPSEKEKQILNNYLTHLKRYGIIDSAS